MEERKEGKEGRKKIKRKRRKVGNKLNLENTNKH